MNRRSFLLSSGAALMHTCLPNLAIADSLSFSSTILYGADENDIGTKLGRLSAHLLRQVNPSLDYSFQNDDTEGGLNAATSIKTAASTGDFLLQASSTTMSLYSCLYSNLPYDPLEDFVPVGYLGGSTYVLVVGDRVPRAVQNIDDYIDWVFNNPEYRNFGAVLYGSEGHLAGLTLAHEKNIALRVQAYGGESIMVEDLLDGFLAAGFIVAGTANSAIAAGRLRIIGVCSAERHEPWPCIPTLQEQGIEGMDFSRWYGWFAPSSISMKQLVTLHQSFKAMQNMRVHESLQASLSLNSKYLTPYEMRDRISKDITMCEALYEKFGLSRVVK